MALRFSPYHDALTTLLVGLALFFAGFGLDQVPRGKAYSVGPDNCSVDVGGKQVKCTATRQDYGMPFISGTKLTEIKPADANSYVPSYRYICKSGCGRHSMTTNVSVLIGLGILYFGVKNFLVDRWIDRKLMQQWEDDNKRNPVKPGKGW